MRWINAKNFSSEYSHNSGYNTYNKKDREDNLIVKNCNNFAEIIGDNHAGGIAGFSVVSKIKVNNCKVENSNINTQRGETGGIIGKSEGKEVNIKDCILNNSNIEVLHPSYYGSAGGIIGTNDVREGYGSNTYKNIKIENCDVFDTEINAHNNAGGILGQGYSVDNININGCDVSNATIRNTGASDACYGNCAGIMSTAYEGGDISITNCNVKASDIELYGDKVANGAGILALNIWGNEKDE